MNVLLVAEESAGIQTLKGLARSGHRMVAVMTSGSEGSLRGASIEGVANAHGCPIWPAQLVKDPQLAKKLRIEEVDIILNVHSLFVMHEEILKTPRIGSFNLHPGPLPQYAGLNAVSWAIYRGEKRHAVTLHWMLPRIDAGAIAYQAAFPIEDEDTALSLSAKCVRKGVPLVLQLLETVSLDPKAIPFLEQDLSLRKYYGRAVPQGGRIHWGRSAREIVDFVRACNYYPLPSPWGHPAARIEGREIGIVKASRTGQLSDLGPGNIGPAVDSGVRVATGDEWVLISLVKDRGRYLEAHDILKPGQLLADGS